MAYPQLFDSDGENRLVRSFLLGLEANCYTYESMRLHMKMCNTSEIPCIPSFATEKTGHMSKGAQQAWLRFLFDLEKE